MYLRVTAYFNCEAWTLFSNLAGIISGHVINYRMSLIPVALFSKEIKLLFCKKKKVKNLIWMVLFLSVMYTIGLIS